MAPIALVDNNGHGMNDGPLKPTRLRREPMKNSGSIDHLECFDITPIIGREYPSAKIKDMLNASNSAQQLRDLAITSLCLLLLPIAHADGSAQSANEVLCFSEHPKTI